MKKNLLLIAFTLSTLIGYSQYSTTNNYCCKNSGSVITVNTWPSFTQWKFFHKGSGSSSTILGTLSNTSTNPINIVSSGVTIATVSISSVTLYINNVTDSIEFYMYNGSSLVTGTNYCSVTPIITTFTATSTIPSTSSITFTASINGIDAANSPLNGSFLKNGTSVSNISFNNSPSLVKTYSLANTTNGDFIEFTSGCGTSNYIKLLSLTLDTMPLHNQLTTANSTISSLNSRHISDSISLLNSNANLTTANATITFLNSQHSTDSISLKTANSTIANLNSRHLTDSSALLNKHDTVYIASSITSDTLKISIHTGISQTSPTLNSLKIYPNPTSTILHIDLTNPGYFTAKISGITGQTIITPTTGTIDVSGLANGIYILTIYDSNAKLISTNKISVAK